MKIFNLFPLTIMQDKIHIEEYERSKLIKEIKKMTISEKKKLDATEL